MSSQRKNPNLAQDSTLLDARSRTPETALRVGCAQPDPSSGKVGPRAQARGARGHREPSIRTRPGAPSCAVKPRRSSACPTTQCGIGWRTPKS